MINCISGTVKEIKDQAIIVDIGQLGFYLAVPIPSRFQHGQSVNLLTYLHWNQETGPSLYGFENDFDKSVFLLIINCSGIGPKIGLATLAHLGAQGFVDAVNTANEKTLSRIPGIGTKKAEQIIVALKHKIVHMISSGKCSSDGIKSQIWQEVSQALESLNYSRSEITSAMHYLAGNTPPEDPSFQLLLRTALGFLSKKA